MLNKELANKRENLKDEFSGVHKDKLYEQIKKEVVYLLIVFIIATIIFKIAFYKENFVIIVRAVAGIFWIFVLPGFYLLYCWYEKMNFIERLMISIAVNAAIMGILSYYVGLIGANIKYHIILLPAIFLAISFIVILKGVNKKI